LRVTFGLVFLPLPAGLAVGVQTRMALRVLASVLDREASG
jgi:hypothetical protein